MTVMHSQLTKMCAAIISNSVRGKKGNKIAPLEPTYKQPNAVDWKPKSKGWNKEFYRTCNVLFYLGFLRCFFYIIVLVRSKLVN